MMSISRSGEPITCLSRVMTSCRLLRLVERLGRVVGDHLRASSTRTAAHAPSSSSASFVARTASTYSTASGDASTAANFAFIAATASGPAAGTIAAAG